MVRLDEPSRPDVGESSGDRPLTTAADFAKFYSRSHRPLENRARSFLTDHRDVEEVVQETFLRLYQALPDLEFEWQALAYSHRVLTNLCIDRYRRDRRRPQVYDLETAGVAEVADEEFTDQPVLRAEDAAIVRDALAELSPSHRAALVMHEIEERPLVEIGELLDIPEEKVKHLLFRARRSLRRLLAGSTVDPAADVSLAGLVGIANKRAVRASIKSGPVVLGFVAAGLLVAVCCRGVVQQQSSPNRALRLSSGSLVTHRPRRVPGHAPLSQLPSRQVGDPGPVARRLKSSPPSTAATAAAATGQGGAAASPRESQAADHLIANRYVMQVGKQTLRATVTSTSQRSEGTARSLTAFRATGQGADPWSYVVSQGSDAPAGGSASDAPRVDQLRVTLQRSSSGGREPSSVSYLLDHPVVVVQPRDNRGLHLEVSGVAVAVGPLLSAAPVAVEVRLDETYRVGQEAVSAAHVRLILQRVPHADRLATRAA